VNQYKSHEKACVSLIYFLLAGSAFAQKSATRIIFNVGVQKAGMYQDVWFESVIYFERCSPLNQTPGYSYDFNMLYQIYSKKTDLSFVYGIGISQKSWNEIWITSGFGLNADLLSYRKDLTYLGLFYGINYDFQIGKKTKLIAGTLINPEFLISSTNEVYNSLGASIRMTVGLEYQAFDNLAIQLTPYFQSAVMNYAKTPFRLGGGNRQTYTPYAFGINLGIVLNRIAD
jgi:hypothetical protein